MECFGARNTVGFSSQVQSGNLPNQNHITYEGIFNELTFDVGKKTELVKDLHFGYARYQFSKSSHDKNINDYLALFVKGNKDGEDRDGRPLNALICLDISGSMGGGLGGFGQIGQFKSRLTLSKQAIKMFISKLRPNDSIGMITFNDQAQLMFEPTRKSEITEQIYSIVDNITTNGGTTIRSGFQQAKRLLKKYIQNNNCKNCQNRIIMLTDVCDNSIQNEKKFIEEASTGENINMTIIGISTQFRSEVCEHLKNVKGFNYFCAVNEKDIKKYVFQTFDFGFFPSAYDVNITIESEDIDSFEVFGAPDSDQVLKYNDDFKPKSIVNAQGFQKDQSKYVITKVKSTFPSEIQIINEKVLTVGGLILLKLKRKSKSAYFKGLINLKYTDPSGEKYQQKYDLNYDFHPQQQYFSQQSLREAIEGYIFASEMKEILKHANLMSPAKLYETYWGSLTSLEEIIPKTKKEDLSNIKKIIEQNKDIKTTNQHSWNNYNY